MSTELASGKPPSLGDASTVPNGPSITPSEGGNHYDARFWVIIVSMCVAVAITAAEFTAIGTALPVIVSELHGKQFIWVGSAYTLGATAPVPFLSTLAQVFGRKAIMLVSLLVFSVGSAICGAAFSMDMLVAGRAIQGVGCGAINTLVQIILSDLVPLSQRGVFNGFGSIAWAIAAGTAPLIGGALAKHDHWRWIFYPNIPICAMLAASLSVTLKLKTPPAPLKEKLRRIDWIGNILIISSPTLVVIALSWAGIQFPWTSPHVFAPLILGSIGLCLFVVYESLLCKAPTAPLMVIPNVTALSGYLQNFLIGIIQATLFYWYPTYWQACKNASPLAAGVDFLGISYSMTPVAALVGILIKSYGRYRRYLWVGWCATIVGVGLLSTLDAHSSRGAGFGYEIIAGVGLGIVYVGCYYPVLAATPVNQVVPVLAFYNFLRTFANVWGVTIGGVVLQNKLIRELPGEFLDNFPQGVEIAFAAIPDIPGLDPTLGGEVRAVFARSLSTVWKIMAGIAGLGLLVSLAMKRISLHTSVDQDWGQKDQGLKEEAKVEVSDVV
ncbi:major facilitator superfamily domain-containing protein [Gloeopeniophorella convolvens]|nr:major facilitator superfamily domain-containing protein [Gloeopeniophorella convolvens]